MTDGTGEEMRFCNRSAQTAAAAFGVLFVLLGGLQFTGGGDAVIGGIMLGFGAVSIVRGMRSSEVIVADRHVETRSMLATRRLSIADLADVEVVVGRTGLNSGQRECLEFTLTDGRKRRFSELNAPPPLDGGPPSEVRAAAAAILERLERLA